MSALDVSRIGELFYRDVGVKEDDLSFESFLKTALKKYEEHQRVAPVLEESVLFSFTGMRKQSKLILRIAGTDSPDLSGIAVLGETCDLKKILVQAYGHLNAEFEGLPINETKVEKILRKNTTNYINANGIKWYLLRNPQKNEVLIKRIETEKENVQFKERESVDPNLSHAENLELLSKSGRIFTDNFFHLGNLESKDLINENLIVVQASPGIYSLSYKLYSPSNSGLSIGALPTIKSLFNLIEPGFVKQTAVKLKVESGGYF
jgi:hypothetical protein